MRIDRQETIAGLPILSVRDMLRFAHGYEFTVEHAIDRLKLGKQKAAELMRELLSRGFVLVLPQRRGYPKTRYYELTDAGRSLCLARAVSPLTRAKAERRLKEFLARCEEVDRRDELAYYVREVRVFGSYITKAPTLGDIDLLVAFEWRPIEGRDIIKYNEQRVRESGRRFGNYLEYLYYSEHEVRLFLKSRSPYISIHSAVDEIALAAKSRVVFRSKRYPTKAPRKKR